MCGQSIFCVEYVGLMFYVGYVGPDVLCRVCRPAVGAESFPHLDPVWKCHSHIADYAQLDYGAHTILAQGSAHPDIALAAQRFLRTLPHTLYRTLLLNARCQNQATRFCIT